MRSSLLVLALMAAASLCSACSAGTPPAAPSSRPPAEPSPSSTSAADTTLASQWVDDFCARPARSAMYLSTLAEAVGSDTGVSDLVPTQQIAASTTASLAATMHDNATQVAGAPASAARTSLTAIYQQLEQGIADGQEELAQLPTRNVAQFTSALQKATADVLSSAATAKQAIANDPTLGPLLAADPSCA